MSNYAIELTCEGHEPLTIDTTQSTVVIGSDPDADVPTWPELNLPRNWLVLRLSEADYSTQIFSQAADAGESPEPATCAYGEWIELPPCRLRVVRTADAQKAPGTDSAVGDASGTRSTSISRVRGGWSEPEIEIHTSYGVELRYGFPGEGSAVVIGRKRRGTDLAVESDPYVSARHLRLSTLGGQPTVEDLGSRHGTTVNGIRIEQPTPLAHGDEVRFGESTLRYICYQDIMQTPEPESAPPPEVLPEIGRPVAADHNAAQAPTGEAGRTEVATEEERPALQPAIPEEVAAHEPHFAEEAAKHPRSAKPSFWSMQRGGGILLIVLVLAAVILLGFAVLQPLFSPSQ
ncbi:MAG: FHA domain-containing protein [Phycisphaerales bacterium]|nr:MAG: FHA domain-containing protein [Phycisphaerales bacterium]